MKIYSRWDKEQVLHEVAAETLENANLTSANLYGADLTDANLADANLTDANLADANLTSANLYGADLTDANLYGADLTGANLADADLTSANLADANLTDANLADANLTSANLYGADLTGANLYGADLTGANLYGADLGDIPTLPSLSKQILSILETGTGTLKMSSWHTCQTAHCLAGWAIQLAGELGRDLESKYGAAAAGALLFVASEPHLRVPDFYATDEKALVDLRERAS